MCESDDEYNLAKKEYELIFFAHVWLYDLLNLCMHTFKKVLEEYLFRKNLWVDKHLVLNFESSTEAYCFEFAKYNSMAVVCGVYLFYREKQNFHKEKQCRIRLLIGSETSLFCYLESVH